MSERTKRWDLEISVSETELTDKCGRSMHVGLLELLKEEISWADCCKPANVAHRRVFGLCRGIRRAGLRIYSTVSIYLAQQSRALMHFDAIPLSS